MTNSNAPTCGDTCGFVHTQNALYGDRLLPEEKMQLAVVGVQSGTFSQRGAAKEFGVSLTSLNRQLKAFQTEHPETSQSEPAMTPIGKESAVSAKKADNNSRLKGIRRFATENGIKKVDGETTSNKGTLAIYNALIAAGIDVPDDIKPRSLLPKQSKASKPKPTSIPPTEHQHDTNQQRIHADDSLSVITDGGDQADSEPEHPAFADNFDLDAVRERVNHDVQQSNRPADFKRAIELLTELDRICTDAWYRRHPEPWGHDDWAHVSSEIEALHSIVGQRAEETADELLRKSAAVEVIATALN